jgi:hypothetical protein
MARVEPSMARKLLRDVVAWSRSIGFAPHRDFAVVERLSTISQLRDRSLRRGITRMRGPALVP